MKNILILLLLIYVANIRRHPMYIPYFKQGQMFPVLDGELTVNNATELNIAIGYYEQEIVEYTEEEINSIFDKYCTHIYSINKKQQYVNIHNYINKRMDVTIEL